MGDKLKKMTREEYDAWLADNRGRCLLCDSKLQLLLKEYWHWYWIENVRPYVQYHSMLVPKRHITRLSEINGEEFEELKKIYEDVFAIFRSAVLKNSEGLIIDRLNIQFHARDTIRLYQQHTKRPEHLHIHLIPDHDHFLDLVMRDDARDCDMKKDLNL